MQLGLSPLSIRNIGCCSSYDSRFRLVGERFGVKLLKSSVGVEVLVKKLGGEGWVKLGKDLRRFGWSRGISKAI